MVTLGFSRAQAERAITATEVTTQDEVYSKAQPWLLKQQVEVNLAEAAAEREIRTFEHMDLDGFALKWGSDNKADSLADCGQRCLEWKPLPPYHMPCNVFVFCGMEMCFAPAQLPPGSRKGWCWLKHQDDPTAPHVNMNGTDRRTATGFVEWHAGVVVRRGSAVRTDTRSARANW